MNDTNSYLLAWLCFLEVVQRDKELVVREVFWPCTWWAIFDSLDPSRALIGSSSRVMRIGSMQLAAFHQQNTMHLPLRAFRRVRAQ
jgi:hypothetical protein